MLPHAKIGTQGGQVAASETISAYRAAPLSAESGAAQRRSFTRVI